YLFPCPCTHRDLHPFPTRRSSDLVFASIQTNQSSLQYGSLNTTYSISSVDSAAPAVRCANLKDSMAVSKQQARWISDRINAKLRSEEHTSELQSRENLVCRLLLEK